MYSDNPTSVTKVLRGFTTDQRKVVYRQFYFSYLFAERNRNGDQMAHYRVILNDLRAIFNFSESDVREIELNAEMHLLLIEEHFPELAAPKLTTVIH